VHDVLFDQLFFAIRKVEIFHFMLQHVPRIFSLIVVTFPFVVLVFDIVFSNVGAFLHTLGDVGDHGLHGSLDWFLINRGRKGGSCYTCGWLDVGVDVQLVVCHLNSVII